MESPGRVGNFIPSRTGMNGGRDKYSHRWRILQNLRDRVDFAYARIGRSQSPEELIERLDDASVVVGDTASDLEDAGAPDNLEQLNDRLVRALREFSDVLAGTSAQFEDPTFATA